MSCVRCSGLLVPHDFLDLCGGMDRWFQGSRCVNCGFLDDPVMRLNRMPRTPLTSLSRGRTHSSGKINAMWPRVQPGPRSGTQRHTA